MIACDQAQREERFHAASDLAGYFRKPYGPGWALVGDAGYHLHPITAQGITDAFLDAERLTDALDAAFTERSTYDDAMAAYQTARDEHVDADVRDDVRLRPGGSAPAARDAAAARGGRRQPASDGRLRQRPGGDAADPGVLQPREHRPHHGRARPADIVTVLNAKQEQLCHQTRWDFSDLTGGIPAHGNQHARVDGVVAEDLRPGGQRTARTDPPAAVATTESSTARQCMLICRTHGG